jgi:biopolymer transport protein TolQ
MRMLLGNGLWHLVTQADSVTKVVLFGLLAASIACWTIVFYKLVLLNLKNKQLKEVLKKLKRVNTLEQLVALTNAESKTYPGHLLANQLNHAKEALQRSKTKERLGKEELVLDELRFSCIEDMIHLEEKYLPVLSVTAAVSPLVGLFGTVWGLTHSFISISEKQAADIVTIAPGIAEALLTTLGGLMVAIPVLIMYHYLRGHVDEIEFKLHKISEKVHAHVRITLLEGKDGHEISITSQEASKGTVAS